jgi:ribonuclease P protein component
LKQTFPKKERLNSKKLIDKLFTEGESFFVYPFKVVYIKNSSEELLPVQVLVSVSKRKFKNATDRNKVKRLVREAYRLNKKTLLEYFSGKEKQLAIGLIFTGQTILPFAQIESKIILILHRLIEQDEQTVG